MVIILPDMKTLCLFALLIATSLAPGQEPALSLDDVMNTAQDWAKENLDEETLQSLGTDQKKVKEFLDQAQKQMQGAYVIDLAELREAAKLILPLLESHEDTLPYALWLKPRMDYLDLANELRLRISPPKVEPGAPILPIPNPTPENERDIWIEKFSERPVPKEAKPYLDRLKPVFLKANVPAELVWIAEVESSFDPRAKSPAGAAGLFQLMPATAKQYGLRTWPLDQRYKPEESAGAAAKYLSALHGRFKDWRLALAAYNSGEGTVQRLLNRTKVKSFDAIATRLPAETQLYVPKVEATILRREGLKLSKLVLPTPR
jgi:membrane-bound lytic murein transglycosylase D